MNKSYVLQKPHVTEKSASMIKQENVYCLEVHPDANKVEIKKCVEEMFNVTVEDIRVVKKAPRNRTRQGRVVGRTKGSKKAYVRLEAGQKIDFFEGV